MYVDDTTLTRSGDSIEKVEKAINHDLENVREWLLANKLSLNVVKTEYLLIGSRFNLRNLGKEPNIFVGDIPIKRVKVKKALGVLIDQSLSWEDHIEKLSKAISMGVGAIRRLNSCVDSTTLLSVYNALVQPHFDYCCEVWDSINVTLSSRLEQLYNRAARIITDCPNVHGQSELARNKLGWRTLRDCRAFCQARLMFKIVNDLAPIMLIEMFRPTDASKHYNLRGSSTGLYIPMPKTEFLKKSLRYSGAKLWNCQPNEAKDIQSLSSFMKRISSISLG